jgi:vacuolar-type H+-ATPase subunit H
MSALSQLLERLRRVRLPPGGAASVVAVPSAGDQLSREVAFLFGPLDELERRGQLLVASARSEAAETETAAREQRHRLLEDARADAERLVAELLTQRRAHGEERARMMLADAEREAEKVLERGRERTPALVEEIVELILDGAG